MLILKKCHRWLNKSDLSSATAKLRVCRSVSISVFYTWKHSGSNQICLHENEFRSLFCAHSPECVSRTRYTAISTDQYPQQRLCTQSIRIQIYLLSTHCQLVNDVLNESDWHHGNETKRHVNILFSVRKTIFCSCWLGFCFQIRSFHMASITDWIECPVDIKSNKFLVRS